MNGYDDNRVTEFRLAAVGIVLGAVAVAVAANLVPAITAARIDPMRALRRE